MSRALILKVSFQGVLNEHMAEGLAHIVSNTSVLTHLTHPL
jgi:hypothetical protein